VAERYTAAARCAAAWVHCRAAALCAVAAEQNRVVVAEPNYVAAEERCVKAGPTGAADPRMPSVHTTLRTRAPGSARDHGGLTQTFPLARKYARACRIRQPGSECSYRNSFFGISRPETLLFENINAE